jgi:hypothetical protein
VQSAQIDKRQFPSARAARICSGFTCGLVVTSAAAQRFAADDLLSIGRPLGSLG